MAVAAVSATEETRQLIDGWSAREVLQLKDAREFICDCERLVGLGFHPDTRFEDYITPDREPSFSADDAGILDARMDEAFAVMDEAHVDPYEMSLREMYRLHPELTEESK
jgi:hypothetical protein